MAHGTQAIFLVAAVIAAVGFALAWFIKQVPLRETVGPASQVLEETAEQLGI